LTKCHSEVSEITFSVKMACCAHVWICYAILTPFSDVVFDVRVLDLNLSNDSMTPLYPGALNCYAIARRARGTTKRLAMGMVHGVVIYHQLRIDKM
jgi:hypothetical protein